jgi:hypothetical protein
MNIAVLGSNCKFSSDLAARLNQLKKTSLVYRYDILSSFKKDIPLYRSLLDRNQINSKSIDVDYEEEEPIKQSARTHLGEYIGDVETRFLNITEETKKTDDFKTLGIIFSALNTKGVDTTTTTYGEQCVIKKLKESARNSQLFTSNLLNMINVYSGILTNSMMGKLLERDPLMVIVKVKGGNTFLPCCVDDTYLDELVQKNPQLIVLEASSVKELLTNNFFISAFNLNAKETEKEIVVVEMPQKEQPLEHHHGILFNMAQNGRIGEVMQMMAQAA